LPLQRAQLPPVPSTLLIPLAARAHGGRYFPWLDCHDAVAPALLARLDADVNSTLDDLHTVLHVLWRTRAIQEAGRAFFATHPQALGVNLGCGLTHYFQWLDGGGQPVARCRPARGDGAAPAAAAFAVPAHAPR